VHGDSWTNNVLFQKGQDGELTDELCSLIDWQTAFQGNPLFDLSFLLASSTDAEVRREIATEVVDLYFDTLAQLYKQQNKELRLTREQVILCVLLLI
jgi:aminoglycoside phosphotransferase (APT) family kinase protein